ncbi:MAG: type II toxin-antitoxin system VapC family toxin [Nitrospirae bacterium]|nr:MAG: type II toxin-antitoxin system VapC family toxin [Nitrospirota bacterium]
MYGVDTNIIVRLLTGDEPSQSAKAKAVFKKNAVFIPETVMLETEWVLRHAYGFDQEEIHQAFLKLCGLPNIVLQNPQHLLTALQWYAEGLDFADAFHIAACRECGEFFTFDKKLVRKADGKGNCRVREP